MSQFTKTSLDYERIASNADNFETERNALIRFQIVMIVRLGISASECMYPSGRADYTGSGVFAGRATRAIFGSMSPPEGALIG